MKLQVHHGMKLDFSPLCRSTLLKWKSRCREVITDLQIVFYFLNFIQIDHLLDRYADGEWLTAEELKLLANTSDLLNSCIDRKFMQSAVDAIDREVIENVHYLLKIVF